MRTERTVTRTAETVCPVFQVELRILFGFFVIRGEYWVPNIFRCHASVVTSFIFADRVVSISIQFNCILICVLQNNTVNLIKAWLTINIIYIEYRKS